MAAKLVGWKIDIKSETRAAEAELLQYASFDGSLEEEEEETEETMAAEEAPAVAEEQEEV